MLDERPIRSFEEDTIGFEAAVDAVAQLVRASDRHGELFGLFGRWGTGKTSFLELLKNKLTTSTKWIDFDALRHQATTDVLPALVAHVAREARGGDEVRRSFSRTVRALTLSVADMALRSTTSMSVEHVQGHFATAEGLEIPRSPADQLREHMELVVNTLLANCDQEIVVIAVDNLDRCRPDAALRFIESLLIFGEVPRLRTVVAADHSALIGFINKEFAGTDFEGALYLEKIFAHTTTIPALKTKAGTPPFIVAAVDSLDRKPLGPHKKAIASLLGAASATRNPRRMKRIVRRLQQAQAVKTEIDLYIVVMSVVLAEAWPALYDWFWICSDPEWRNLLPGLASKSMHQAPRCACDESLEFLRTITNAVTPSTMSDLKMLRQTVLEHRTALRI